MELKTKLELLASDLRDARAQLNIAKNAMEWSLDEIDAIDEDYIGNGHLARDVANRIRQALKELK